MQMSFFFSNFVRVCAEKRLHQSHQINETRQIIDMKTIIRRAIPMLIAALPLLQCGALTLPENAPVLVYNMPLTHIDFVIEYDEIVTEVGPFYQYSERYLGTKDVITKAEKQYVLTGVHAKMEASADASRSYVLEDKSGKLSLLTFTPHGTLAGYNVSEPKAGMQPMPKADCPKPKADNGSAPHLMPLLEEQLMASSRAKMAEGAAKQIYRVREMRLNLIGGEVDHAPADGEALRLMLQALDEREKELIALFVGTKSIKHHFYVVRYTPEAEGKNTDKVLIRFSKHFGIVAADDLSGEPLTLHLAATKHKLETPEKEAKLSPTLYYNIAGEAAMTVTYQDATLLSRQAAIAQWGVSVPLNSSMLDGHTQIVFDPLTGNIVSIEK